MQIHLHEEKILQIHNVRPEFVKNITAINQSESSILIGVITWTIRHCIIMILMWACPGNMPKYYLDKTTLLYKYYRRRPRLITLLY